MTNMRTAKLHFLLYALTCLLCATPALAGRAYGTSGDKKEAKLTADGPYFIYNEDGSTRIVSVSNKGKISDKTHKALPRRYGFEVTSHDQKHRFHVTLQDSVVRPGWHYGLPRKLFVMSDPHGNLDCFVSLLQNNGVIDKKYHWAYGENRLVIIGDVFDRGNDVTQIFWLIYQLEQEARKAGGQVDFLLGNHEPLVLMNDLRYTKPKYKLLADTLHTKYADLVGRNTELGRWLCTRNTMQTVGRNLFTHAGISAAFLEQDLDIPTVNEQMSMGLYKRKAERKATSPLVYFLHGSYGPIWYRGMVRKDEKYHPLATDSLQMILGKYDVDRVIVGHTIFDDITSFYDGQVIGVNVDNQENREQGKGRAILIENGEIFVVGDKGILRKLEKSTEK